MMILLTTAAAVALTAPCRVVDGDTLRCGAERIRLLGIDAPEKAGHCRPGRECAPGDPAASTRNLERLIRARPLAIERFGKDRYGRTLAIVWAGRENVNCGQLAARAAIYVRRWDELGRVRRCRRS